MVAAYDSMPLVRRTLRGAKLATRTTYRTPFARLPDRDELPELFNRRGLLGCGVEVGVQRGEYSECLLDIWRGRHLISVDPWRAAPSDEYVDMTNVSQEEHDACYAETAERLRRFGDRSTIWRMTGDEAAARIPHHSLDFVYLDARHDYASVAHDLECWFDKVRPGGVIAGHDYVDGTFPEGNYGVKSAVDEFFRARRKPVRSTVADAPWISWFVTL